MTVAELRKEAEEKVVVGERKPIEFNKKVTVKAFTGMMIGEFEVVKETKKLLVVKTKKGDELKFDKATGLQTNGNNPKFANRIEL